MVHLAPTAHHFLLLALISDHLSLLGREDQSEPIILHGASCYHMQLQFLSTRWYSAQRHRVLSGQYETWRYGNHLILNLR